MQPLGGETEHLFLTGGGVLGELISSYDWSRTSLGPISGWSTTMKVTTGLALRSAVPIVMLWGTEGIMIYNDAYSVFAGGRHPQLLGSPVREGWPEVGDFNDNVMKVVLAGGTLAYSDQELTLYRHGRPEQVFMDLDYSPIADEHGRPVGVIAIVVETTEKVAAERWRDAERERMRQMFAQAPGFMAMLHGPEHVFELANAAYMQLIGHRDVVGLTVREALPDIEGQGYFELLDRVYESGEPFMGKGLKAWLQPEPGAAPEEHFLDLIYQPVRDPDGRVVGIFVEGADVTERHLAEISARESGTLFRTFAEAMPNHVWRSGPDGTLDWFNSQTYAYSGRSPGELDGDRWASIVHPDDLPRTAELWAAALESGSTYETEFRLLRSDGVYRWHLARAVPIPDESGAITAWIGTNTDIDDHKRISERLSESERRFRLSQNAAGIASLEVDIESGQVMGSDRFWSLWGLEPQDSVPIGVLEDLVIPEDRHIRSNDESRRAGTLVPSVEYRIRRVDNGEVRWMARHIEFVNDETGRPTKMFGVIRDITEEKATAARQQLLTHELEHRIKNILAMVLAIASQTLRSGDLQSSSAAFMERLRALSTAHDMLTATRWTEASLDEIVRSALTPFPAERVSASGPAVSLGPKRALSLALAINELATNASKYGALSNETGRVSIKWRVTGERETRTLHLVWSENGGPAVAPPARHGFGRFLIERVLAADFNGSVRLDYKDHGVECALTAPLPDETSRKSIS